MRRPGGQRDMVLEFIVLIREAIPPVPLLRLNDFLEVDSTDDRDIVVAWEEFHQELKQDLLMTAVSRYREV
ncbi:hypothetical protein MGYG_09133 [Nannizzia gypsea CBS 118893]|uniref:Uncharacterized protein n=1 Tax=Arthroderma gypseum (strain ATCC MYA-4604 / CBS 118893) TaxID=535722 RepID=E4V0X2_ARTGP|nr:hypothetical protein MGYG_09133 [Nannizzia gypsea CBS 118893]EFR03687.1 hypothetical protein MGYG_09133 [Nannizzia gypsea CBS 118893]